MSKPKHKKQPEKKQAASPWTWKRILAMALAGLLCLLFLLPYCMQIVGYAESSQEIMAQLEALQSSAESLDAQQAELQSQITQAQTETMDYVSQKAVIDQMLQVTRSSITNTEAQIQEYSLLISARQEELDAARAAEAEMLAKYQSRIRAMEEYGDVTYWSVLFQATSLSDMIDRMEMVREIARADQQMLSELEAVSNEIAAAQEELESAKAELEDSRATLGAQQAELAEEQAQSDALILAMTGDVNAMEQVSAYYEAQEAQLDQEIAETLQAYYIAVAQEEALAAAQAAVEAAAVAAQDAENYAAQAQQYYEDTNDYVNQAKRATNSAAAQTAWDNAAWSAYLAQTQADKAQSMVQAVENEAAEAQRQCLTNPDAAYCIDEALAYKAPAQAAADKAQAIADQAAPLAATAEAYVTALKASEAAAQAAAAQQAATQPETRTQPEDNSSYTASYADTLGNFSYPLPGGSAYVSSAYGNREHPIYGYYTFHNGVDLAANSGTPVYATKSGTVVAASFGDANGNYVTISHDGGVSSCYLHLESYCVSAGDRVSQGQVIGYVGSTGDSTGPHLHFSMLVDGSYVNPMEYVG